jgi:hypothetical protein
LRFSSRGVRIWLQSINPVFRSANLIIAPLTFIYESLVKRPPIGGAVPAEFQMTQYEIDRLWLGSTLNLRYAFDDLVLIKSGERRGETGRILALFELEPNPHNIVEFADGSSIAAFQSDLEPAA